MAQQATNLHALRQPVPQEAQMPAVTMGFGNLQSFELMQRAAKLLANSTLVPVAYRAMKEVKEYGKVVGYEENPNALSNCVVSLNMAQRMGADPLMVMQNLYIVEGRPSWSSQFIIAAINSCGRYSPLRFEMSEPGEEREVTYQEVKWVKGNKQESARTIKVRDRTCIAWAVEKETGQRLESPVISIAMAEAEGWLTKNGSKWQTMPDVMLRYRSAAFFGKLYAPELLMGLQTAEEVGDFIDMSDVQQGQNGNYVVNTEDLRQQATPAEKTVASDEPPFDVDTTTGEVLTQQTVAEGLRQQREAEPVQQHQQEEQGSQQQAAFFGLDDALEAVRRGAFDEARDIARSLSEKDADIVEQTIANQQRAGGTTRTRRQREVE